MCGMMDTPGHTNTLGKMLSYCEHFIFSDYMHTCYFVFWFIFVCQPLNQLK